MAQQKELPPSSIYARTLSVMPTRNHEVRWPRGALRWRGRAGFVNKLMECSVSSSASSQVSSRPSSSHPAVTTVNKKSLTGGAGLEEPREYMGRQTGWTNAHGKKRSTCPVVFFEKVDGPPCYVADELIFHLEVPAKALLLLIRVAPNDLVTTQETTHVRQNLINLTSIDRTE